MITRRGCKHGSLRFLCVLSASVVNLSVNRGDAEDAEVTQRSVLNFYLVSECGPGSAGADWPPIVLGVSTRECVIDARFDIALGLAANCGQLRHDKIARTFEHPLFAEREWFDIAEIGQMLEHIGNLEDVARAHFVREFLKAVLPIISGGRKIIC